MPGHERMLQAQMMLEHFPGSTWLVAQAATAQYNLRNFDEAQALFEELIQREPYRVEVRMAAPPACCVCAGLWV